MQIADTERLILKTTDAVQRSNLQKEVESLEALQIEALEQLRKSGGVEIIAANRSDEPDEVIDSNKSLSVSSTTKNSSSTTNKESQDNIITNEELNTKYRYTTVVDSTTKNNKSSSPVTPEKRGSGVSSKPSDSNVTIQKFNAEDFISAVGVGTGMATKVKAPIYGKGSGLHLYNGYD